MESPLLRLGYLAGRQMCVYLSMPSARHTVPECAAQATNPGWHAWAGSSQHLTGLHCMFLLSARLLVARQTRRTLPPCLSRVTAADDGR